LPDQPPIPIRETDDDVEAENVEEVEEGAVNDDEDEDEDGNEAIEQDKN